MLLTVFLNSFFPLCYRTKDLEKVQIRRKKKKKKHWLQGHTDLDSSPKSTNENGPDKVI